jgi:hypothetical protein
VFFIIAGDIPRFSPVRRFGLDHSLTEGLGPGGVRPEPGTKKRPLMQHDSSTFENIPSDVTDRRPPLSMEQVLKDLRAGLRTKEFLDKYRITVAEFESLLRMLIRKGLFTKDEYREWKNRKPDVPAPTPEPGRGPGHATPKPQSAGPDKPTPGAQSVETYIIPDPERTNSWALELFSTAREDIHGAQFKVSLQGRKYLFIVEKLVYRGSVFMLEDERDRDVRTKREEAVQFIAKHGWAAYLEYRAIEANFGEPRKVRSNKKARLVLLKCKHDTYLAALHTPAPAINLYVGSSEENVRSRLDKAVDLTQIFV